MDYSRQSFEESSVVEVEVNRGSMHHHRQGHTEEDKVLDTIEAKVLIHLGANRLQVLLLRN